MERGAQAFSSPYSSTGWLGLATMAAALVITLYDGTGPGHLAAASAILLLAAVIGVLLLRPGLVVHEDHLLVRNSLTDVVVPWTAIREVSVGLVMQIAVGDRIVRAVAFGRTPSELRKPGRRTEVDYTDLVVARLREVAETHGGLRPDAGTDVVTSTSWRWPDIGVLIGLGVLTTVAATLAALGS